MSNKKVWYWVGTIDCFEGIFCGDEGDIPSQHGDFPTFAQAKADAKEYYQTTIDYAKEAKLKVCSTKRPKPVKD